MKKYIPVDFDEKGNVILGRERNTPTSNGFIPTTWAPNGGGSGDEGSGLKSISISPVIQTTPALDTIVPLYYDDLIAQGYEPSPEGDISVVLEVPNDFQGGTYDITITPTSDWYAGNAGLGNISAKGEPLEFTAELEYRAGTIGMVLETNDPESESFKQIVLEYERAE